MGIIGEAVGIMRPAEAAGGGWMGIMVILVVKLPGEGYKISYVDFWQLTYSKKMIVFCVRT